MFPGSHNGNNVVNTNSTQYMWKYNRFMDPVKEVISNLCRKHKISEEAMVLSIDL